MSDTVRWRLRPDLEWETIHSGRAIVHVVKDPVTGRFFHFDPREVSILRLLDGLRRPADVLTAVRQSRPDELFSTDALLRFLADARRNGLVMLCGGAKGALKDDARTRRHWNLLTWKVPVWNPARAIAALRPVTAFAASRGFAIAWLAVVVSAALLVMGRFEDVAARWPEGRAWLSPAMLLTVLGVLFGCKVVHELAHALVADRFGVRVQECGLMLFYFLPSFYCDVSDAWLVRSPRKRILISAAGMLAELGLAGAATWLWWFSQPGPFQSICLAVMVTCSINTLLLNGNPLMRFDGYFVLVDLVGIPNLAARSAEWWRSAWQRLAYGLEQPLEVNREGALLAVYGAASLVYRVFVISALLWGFHAALEARGAGVFSAALAVVVTGGFVAGGVRSVVEPWRDPIVRRTLRTGRAATSLVVVLLLIALAAWVPLPRSVEADFVVEPAAATSVFVQTGGQLVSILPAGSAVKRGDEIARLDDFETVRRRSDLETQRAIAESRLESARVKRTIDPAAGREIPALVESLAAVEEHLELARKQEAELRITAPCDGVLIPPPNVPAVAAAASREGARWSGSPFDGANLGSTLKPGTRLALVASSGDLSAVGYVSQRRIALVRPGQAVRLALDGAAGEVRTGVVDEVSPAPVEELPRELVNRIPVSPSAAGQSARPLEPMYRVRVRLDDPRAAAAIGSLGTAKVTCERASIVERVLGLVAETFRVDL